MEHTPCITYHKHHYQKFYGSQQPNMIKYKIGGRHPVSLLSQIIQETKEKAVDKIKSKAEILAVLWCWEGKSGNRKHEGAEVWVNTLDIQPGPLR